MNRNKKILNVTMAAGMAAVLGTTPVIAAAQEADRADRTRNPMPPR